MSKKRKIVSLFKLAIFLIGLITFLSFKDKTKNTISQQENIRAAIIPHHLVAVDFINDLGLKLKNNSPPPSKILIIGPNHDEVGIKNFITDTSSFSDKNNLVQYLPDLVTKDHACYAPKNTLQTHLTNIKISCILISYRTKIEEIYELEKTINSLLEENDILIASVDFSHYLPLSKANEKDLITKEYLNNFDTKSILNLNNDHLDSPKTIALLFKYLKNNSITNYKQINHSNSAIILKAISIPSTTSYFEYIYY